MKSTHNSIALAVLAVSAQLALADPLGTAFTYQGRLADGGQPANGSYDLRFILYDAEIGGSQQGNILTNSALAVSGGLFTTALDFGATVFCGDVRWLEIAVRTNGSGGFVPLQPRQPLTPTPYAQFAANTATLGGQSPAAFAPASGSSAYVARTGDSMAGPLSLPDDGLTVGDHQLTMFGGHVGIGAGNLKTPLSVQADASGGINVGEVPVGGNIFTASDGDPGWTVLTVSRQAGNIIQFAPHSGGGGFAFSGGNVGIGTTSPTSALDVAGTIRASAFQGDGSGLNNLDGGAIVSSSVTSTQLAPGAAAANLQASGLSGVPRGALVLSTNLSDTNLTAAGYVQFGAPMTVGNAWRARAPFPFGPRESHTAVWTGTEMLVWGGISDSRCENDGARYKPALDVWTPMATNDAPTWRYSPTAVWTGREMIVWGGQFDYPEFCGSGARYDPVSDTWCALNNSGSPAARVHHIAVWTGSAMLIWGGNNASGHLNDGGCYSPASDTWTPITTSTNGPAPRDAYAVWAGSELLIWGGYANGQPLTDGWRYHPASNTWAVMNSVNAPTAGLSGAVVVWTGQEMIIWGCWYEWNGGGVLTNNCWRYNPATDSWRQDDRAGAPVGRQRSTAVWTGTEMLVWGGYGGGYPNDVACYSPSTDSWASLTPAGAPVGRYAHTAVWTGEEMIISGGRNDGGRSSNTYSYSPLRFMWLYQRP
jgi:N-acetylneuraminic acid mutarotase